jgi:hypothetical protein
MIITLHVGWLFVAGFIFSGLIFHLVEAHYMLRRKDKVMEILRLNHNLELISKNVAISEENLKTTQAQLNYLGEMVKVSNAHVVLMRFKDWWHREGKHEFEIVQKNKKQKSEGEIFLLESK